MDIIKLYGAGIEMFVPDEVMGHDFYKVANEIINHPTVQLELTIDGDDICKPCKKYQNVCIDELTQIPGISSKDVYNKLLDTRIIELYQLQNDTITAFELCERFYQTHENIWQIWQEEKQEVTIKRHDLFVLGAEKYLEKHIKYIKMTE